MSTLRTYNLQNPDSASVNIELTSDGGAVAAGILTATTLNATTITGVSTAGITTAYINTLSGISTISADSSVYINQNLVFPSGKGIDFSATANSSGTMTSELLADYEEGSWDCRPTTSTSSIVLPSGISGVSYNGTYVKIGSMVYLTGYFETSQTSADTSVVYLRLPFAVNGTSNMWSSTGTETSLWSFPSGVTYITVRPESGQSYATFKGCGSGLQRVDMTANRIFASSNMYWLGMMMYRTS